jgi:hypothetical protein
MASGPKFSLSLGAKKPTAGPRPSLGKRPRSAFQDDDHDEDNEAASEQTITGLENGLTIGLHETPKKPLVIPALKNRNFGDEARRKRQKSALPGRGQKDTTVAENIDDGAPKTYGLIINGEKTEEPSTTNGHAEKDGDAPSNSDHSAGQDMAPKTDEELALEALLGNKPTTTKAIAAVTEEEAYRNDAQNAPDAPSMAAYNDMPVEDFGRALLAGMGWKEGEAIGRRNRGKAEQKPRDLQRRPEQLGLGAKENTALRAESGADRKSRLKGVEHIYNPVVLRNKATGETMTESELKARQEQEKLELEAESSSKKKDSRNRDKGRDRDRDRDKDRDSDRRHRRDGHDRRRRDDDTDSNEEYERRRKRKQDRERRRNDEDDAGYSKSRSRRDRSSSPDSKHRRHRRRERSASASDKRTDQERRDRDRDRDRDRRKRDEHYSRESSRHERRH